MRTLGIDLASKPEKTGLCEIEWGPEAAKVVEVRVGVNDQDILNCASELKLSSVDGEVGDAIGIDAPFGWPTPFVKFVNHLQVGNKPFSAWDEPTAKSLCYRLTDLHVRERLGLVPLSISSDKTARPAMRCSWLLWKLAVTDRSGVSGVFEVYPAAALRVWGPELDDGKPLPPGVALATKANLLLEACDWLSFEEPKAKALFMGKKDAFDAVVSYLVARAASLGRTTPPPVDGVNAHRARLEGWIAFPREDCSIRDLLART